MSSPDAGGDNGRVTMAILATKLDRLHEDLREWREESRGALRQCQSEQGKRHDDHESRLRSLEGSNRQGLYRDIGAFFAALAAGVAGALIKSP